MSRIVELEIALRDEDQTTAPWDTTSIPVTLSCNCPITLHVSTECTFVLNLTERLLSFFFLSWCASFCESVLQVIKNVHDTQRRQLSSVSNILSQ